MTDDLDSEEIGFEPVLSSRAAAGSERRAARPRSAKSGLRRRVAASATGSAASSASRRASSARSGWLNSDSLRISSSVGSEGALESSLARVNATTLPGVYPAGSPTRSRGVSSDSTSTTGPSISTRTSFTSVPIWIANAPIGAVAASTCGTA